MAGIDLYIFSMGISVSSTHPDKSLNIPRRAQRLQQLTRFLPSENKKRMLIILIM